MSESLDWHALDLPDEVELAELLYKRNPVEEGGEYVDGFAVTPGGTLTWADAQESGYDKHYYAAAAAMLAALKVAQRNTIEHDPTRNGGIPAGTTAADLGVNAEPADDHPYLEPEPILPEGYEWMICELMGHICHVGRVLEVEKFGSKMARVDVPKRGIDGGITWETHWFTANAVYRLTPTDEATVMCRIPSTPQIGRYHQPGANGE